MKKKLFANVAEFIFSSPKPKNIAALFLKKSNVAMRFLLTLFFPIIFLVIFSVWFINSTRSACLTDCKSQDFTISRGESLDSISLRLQNANLVKNATVFKIIAYWNKNANKIQAGDFNIDPSLDNSQISQLLTKGNFDIKITIVEGFRREEIADRLQKKGLVNFDTKEFIQKTGDLEGKLFPDTYFFPKETSVDKVIGILTKNFEKKVGQISEKDLILASLIEREVARNEDRLIVSGILAKRLQNNWPLQIDATVQYALSTSKCKNISISECSWWPKSLTKNDLGTNSPYNTYQNSGLPPAPICNPSLSAINAARNPQTSSYWYYLTDKNGTTHFAATLEEHNTNIKQYLLKD